MAKIASDSTVATVWPHLTHPREYVADIRQKMMKCAKEHGNALVRIGITGSGQKPCYRIAYETADGEAIFGSYWDNAEPLDNEKAETTNWSTASMNFGEVDKFLKEKVNWKAGG